MSDNADHVEILRCGPRRWNAWRALNPTTTPNLGGVRLNATERQMGVVNGGPINLASARLRRAHLRFATLTDANLTRANLAGADLTDARLDGANLASADLSNASLVRTDLTGTRLSGARLNGANLLETRNLTQGQLDDAFGDGLTELPPHLTRPPFWTDSEADFTEELAGFARSMLRTKGGMTWLIGSAQFGAEALKVK
jgi:hypothetical protein